MLASKDIRLKKSGENKRGGTMYYKIGRYALSDGIIYSTLAYLLLLWNNMAANDVQLLLKAHYSSSIMIKSQSHLKILTQ